MATTVESGQEIGPDSTAGAGAPDGSGVATVALGARRVCFELWGSGLALPAAAHIHQAPAGATGPILVTLAPPDASGRAAGCVRSLDLAVVEALAADPADFYVDVHTSEFPDGAVRGQLAPASSFAGAGGDLYDDLGLWLCHPDLDPAADVCRTELDATSVAAGGTLTADPLVVPHAPPVDCFWVYPTANLGDEGNAPFDGDYAGEIFMTRSEAGRFSSACTVHAPLYRQRTLRAPSDSGVDHGAVAYADVLAAFRHYLAGAGDRPFVVVGHSQGAEHLRRLVAEVIETDPALRARLVSALLIGTTVSVPLGADVGGSFQSVPACRSADQTGCVVSYASFRDTAPPTEDAIYGRSPVPGNPALCTNPAALGGGPGDLTSYFDRVHAVFGPPRPNLAWEPTVPDPPHLGTPFVALPGLVTAKCVTADDFSYLSISLNDDPGLRVDDVPADPTPPQWGLHTIDISMALGDLVGLVRAQAAAWTAP